MIARLKNFLGKAGLCAAVFVIVCYSIQELTISSQNLKQEAEQGQLTRNDNRCPDVLNQMTQGHWKTRKVSQKENMVLEQFYRRVLREKGVPETLQRPDGHCGRTGYDHVTSYIRAMCNPVGTTPCCYLNRCRSKSIEQCQCENCYDLRQQIHAEYSTWIPSDTRCIPKEFSSEESCELLDGGSVYFVGDSLVRHMYTAFLMTVRGNFKDGGMLETESTEWKLKCSGMDMFGEGSCRLRLDKNPVNICQGKLTIMYEQQKSSNNIKDLLFVVTKVLARPKTLVVVGVGLHDNLNTTTVQHSYLEPTLSMLQKSGIKWPKILFVDTSSPGIQKKSTTQTKSDVLKFNGEIEKYLNAFNIPVMKTFNMTNGVRSFDGTHYTLGVNVMKARILLNYIEELKTTGQW